MVFRNARGWLVLVSVLAVVSFFVLPNVGWLAESLGDFLPLMALMVVVHLAGVRLAVVLLAVVLLVAVLVVAVLVVGQVVGRMVGRVDHGSWRQRLGWLLCPVRLRRCSSHMLV